MEKKPARAIALLPIGVFLVLYLGLGIVFEYVLKIKMGFYNIPIIGAFLAAILVACLQNRSLSFDQKTEIMGRGVGDKNIIIMVLIFFTAGIFSAIVRNTISNGFDACSLLPFVCSIVTFSQESFNGCRFGFVCICIPPLLLNFRKNVEKAKK